jgi:EAL domain-containing protein (putative c-di-GMP-specific phosphodiesterase class I)/AmiR/NasT family two-component response regulator
MPFRGLRFLVVDDHSFQRALMVRLLQSLGAAATHAADDGLAALDVVRDPARPVDIVISDISMPRMDGLEFVRRLAELGAPVSLIVSSALERGMLEGVAAMARAYGARLLGVIGKPPTAAKLLPLVEAHTGARRRHHGRDFTLEEVATSWVSGDFDVVFEPQVATADGSLQALHAAPRWRHPEHGMLAADIFADAVRSRGLQEEFAWFLLDGALDACRTWRGRGLPASVSIPLLLDELTDVSIATRILQAAQGKGVDAQDVILCLPAQPRVDDPRVLENIARLRMHGFTLEAEGCPVEEGIRRSLQGVRIAATAAPQVIADARAADLRIVATGVRDRAQWQQLQAAGCSAVQGPVVAPPLPAAEILRWVRQWEQGQGGGGPTP